MPLHRSSPKSPKVENMEFVNTLFLFLFRLEEKRRATKPEIKDKRVLDLKEKLEAKRAGNVRSISA